MTHASEGTSGDVTPVKKSSSRPALLGVGLPDDDDRENITRLMATYDRKFPYPHPWSIGKSVESGLAETTREAGAVQEGRSHRALSLPEPFLRLLKKGYPLIISNKEQFQWFLHSFPNLDLTNSWNDHNDDYKHMGKGKK